MEAAYAVLRARAACRSLCRLFGVRPALPFAESMGAAVDTGVLLNYRGPLLTRGPTWRGS